MNSEVDMSWRSMTEAERGILNKLLDLEFPGSVEVRSQVVGAEVESIDSNGSFRLKIPVRAPQAAVSKRIPVEGCYRDADGVNVHVLLHVVGGKAQEVEVYKDDSSDVVVPVSADAIRLE